MELLGLVVIGAIVGAIARWLSPAENNPQGFLATSALGIAGSLLATGLGHAFHLYRWHEHAGLAGAVIGSLLVLGVWRWTIGNRQL